MIARSTDPIVVPAIPVFVLHMLPPGLLEVEMPIAILAVVVISVLYVVLPQYVIALKVEVAVVAGPVRIGILLMLLESAIMPKPSFATVTVCHDFGVEKKEKCGSMRRSRSADRNPHLCKNPHGPNAHRNCSNVHVNEVSTYIWNLFDFLK